MDLISLKKEIDVIFDNNDTTSEKLQQVCDFLRQTVDHYHWVGFYFHIENKEELKLAQFSGNPTEHTVIPFGKGICGQVAMSNENFVVQDVTGEDNYISCGIDVKSEIVIPIFKNNKNIGQIDIDSHDLDSFTPDDEVLLEYVCQKVSNII